MPPEPAEIRADGPGDAMEQIRALAPEAVAEMRRLLLAEETPSALKVRIAESVLDRAYGKPQQYATVRQQYQPQDCEIVIGEIQQALEEREAERRRAKAGQENPLALSYD